MAMRPRVSKRERKLLLSYQLPHRIHCAEVYPIQTASGSTILLYGHDRGLRILWRGGRPSTANNSSPDVDAEDDELDPDCPYPAIIQDINIDAGSEVLHLAIPSIAELSSASELLPSTALVAIASTDGAVSILRLPLAPPAPGKEAVYLDRIGRTQTVVCEGGQIPAGIALKLTPGSDAASAEVLVATATQSLVISRLILNKQGLSAASDALNRKVQLSSAVRQISFHSSPRSSQLLLADTAGCVRIFDPLAPSDSRGDSALLDSEKKSPQLGKWITTFHAPYPSSNGSSTSNLSVLRRKKVLDVKFVLGGKRILALLADGEWGMWDLTNTSPDGKSFGSFNLRGYLSTTGEISTAASSKPRAGTSRLAPTTPNTRKAKAENLFSGAPKATTAVPQGGISVSPSPSRTGLADESVVLWYANEVYTIPSIASFCQRSASNEGGNFGSLYGPGLVQLSEINLRNENISAIAQFATAESASNLGQMNIPRDLFVAAEYQAIVLQSVKAPVPARGLFQAAAAAAQPPLQQDQRMLDVGELDLGGMDRLLDSMAGTRPRKVGFAPELV